MRIAIACSGLGRVRRGFETFAEDLFHHLQGRGEVDVTLFKGGGAPHQGEARLWNVPRGSRIWRLFGRRVDPYIAEQITFAPSLSRHLKRGDFDLVHLSDGQLGWSLLRLAGTGSKRFKILFSNGGGHSPSVYRSFDYVHQVNPVEFTRAVHTGNPSAKMMLIPHGVTVERYAEWNKEKARAALGISQRGPIVLSVGALEPVKRHDFLIACLASMREDLHLLIAGEGATNGRSTFESMAHTTLGDRITIGSFPRDVMPQVYAAADLYVHPSTQEGFGLALIEAMASGLPVLHHDNPVMNWIVGDAGRAVDMTEKPVVVRAINDLLRDSNLRRELEERGRNRAGSKFSWSVLLPKYIEMYQKAVSSKPN